MEANENPTPQPLLSSNAQEPSSPSEQPKCKFIFSDKHTLAVTDEQKMHLDQYSVSSAQDMQAYLQSH